MRNIGLKVGTFAAVLLTAGSLYAGLIYGSPVSTTTGAVYGQLSAARYSSDTRQAIGCQTWATGGVEYGYCSGVDSAGNYKGCMTTDQHLVNMARSVSSISYIYFVADTSGICTYIDVENHSEYLH